MTGLLFAHPEWMAPGLAAIAAVALALAWAARRSRLALRAVLGDGFLRDPLTRRQVVSRSMRDAALVVALLLVWVGLLGPRIGRERIAISTSGIDVVVILDTSRSMDARDVPPSRFVAAQRAAKALIGGLSPGDRAALAVFAGRGILLTPLTSDHAALVEMIGSVETDLVKPGGSNLPGGVHAALDAFEPVDERPRTLFVLSDGESAGYATADAVVPAVRADTQVHAAAFGTREGATIPDHGVPLRDDRGEIVTTHRRLSGLEELGERTGGRLFVADEWGHFDVKEALDTLRAPVAAEPGEFALHPITVPVVLPFAALAGLLLLLEWLARARPPVPRYAGLLLIGAITFAASAREAGERPPPDS